MISSINTPVRWYEDIFESERFSNDCDIERFELISDKTRLLPFQFRRPKSPDLISRWFLRKECQDPMIGLLNTNDSLFTIDAGFWYKVSFSIINGKAKSTGPAGQLKTVGIFQDTEYYDVKIIVSELSVTAAFTITAESNGLVLATITEPGTYYYKFLANATTQDFEIVTSFSNTDDYVIIEQIQAYKYQKFDTLIGDIDLPTSLLSLINLNTTSDLIQYCGNNLPFQIPCGRYYMIITYGTDSLCYSELLTVKDFIPSQSPFTMLEWTNTCDLSDIIYQTIDSCKFTNRLYIDNELAKMEYPFKEEGEENGNMDLNITFQKWEKTSNLMVAKCPEFIVDALTAIRLHDTISLTKSIRKKQFQVLAPIEVEKIEYENTSVFVDCATNVDLKLLLKDKVVDSTCCNNETIPSCLTCTINVTGMDVEVTEPGEYYFGTKDGDFGLFIKTVTGYEPASSTNQVVCVPGQLPWINLNDEYWTTVPSFATSTVEDATKYHIAGYTYDDTFVKITITFYDEFDTQISQYVSGNYTAAQFLSGFDILKSDAGFPCPFFGYAILTISSFALNCDYGMSEEKRYDYDMHPLVETWYNALVGAKPSCELMFDLNKLVEGLDTDGNLNEMDLIHVMAGMETDEQRLLPLFTSSGTPFSTVNTVTMNAYGVKGNGTDSYIDTNWAAAVNAVYYLQDSCSMLIKSKHPTGYTGMAIGSSESTTNCKSCIALGINGAFNLNSNNSTFIGTGINNMLISVIRNNGTDFNGKFGTSPVVPFADASINPVNMFNNMTIGALNTDSGPSDFSPATYQFVYIGSGIVDHLDINTRLNAYLTARGVA